MDAGNKYNSRTIFSCHPNHVLACCIRFWSQLGCLGGWAGLELSWAENTGSTVEGSVATVAGNLSPLHFFCMFCDFVFCRVGQVGKSRKHGTTIQAGLRKSRKDWSLPSWALW